jgi:hypothetical protein
VRGAPSSDAIGKEASFAAMFHNAISMADNA